MPNDQISRTADAARGREAERPQDIPARGWKDIARRAWKDFSDKNLSLVAGGVTYYVILALFPGLAAVVSIYGLVADPRQIENEVNSMSGLLPGSAEQLIGGELHQLASASGGALGIGAVVGILLALWSASRGMSGMITALDIAYDQPERRGFFRFNVLALVLTLGLIIGGLIVVALVAGLPALLSGMGARSGTWIVASIVEWPVLVVFVITMLAILYRYAPDRDEPKWRWISPGAVTAAALWLITSILFSVYVSHFGSYNKTYGSLGAIIVLLTWLWISVSAVLFGAEINAESERQTKRDTTVGTPEPMGRRGAVAADTLGASDDGR
jgi:membrane protein